jgi:hypothetical protein
MFWIWVFVAGTYGRQIRRSAGVRNGNVPTKRPATMAPVTPTATNPNFDFLEVLLTTSRLVISSGMFFQWITNSEYVKPQYTTEFLNFVDVSFLIFSF